MRDRAVGIDIGGTHLRAAVVRADGSVECSSRVVIGQRDPEVLLAHIAQVHRQLACAFHDDVSHMPLGVGVAAQINVADGHVVVAPNLGWRDVPFGAMLRAHAQRVRLVNDLNAITVGESRVGAGRGFSDVLCVFVGTGVGMGAVAAGRLIEGAHGLATELGHIKVGSIETGRLCGCGDRGCLEAYTSGAHLPACLLERIEAGLTCRLTPSDHPCTAAEIESAAVLGDAAALGLWGDVSQLLGRSVATAVTLFDPAVLILGGGVLVAAPSLLARTTAAVLAHLSWAFRKELRVETSALGDLAGAIGAGLLALEA